MRRSAVPVRGARSPAAAAGHSPPTGCRTGAATTWCVQRLVGSPARAPAIPTGQPVVDEPAPAPVRGERRSSCPFRATLPPRPPTTPQRSHSTAADPRPPLPTSPRSAPAAGRCARQRRRPHVRRAGRPPRDRAGARRGRHRAHLRDPGAHAPAGTGRRGHHRPGPHRHGQDPGLRSAAAAARRPAVRPAGRRRAGADRSRDVPQALVVVPTRELCVQVAKDIADAGVHLGIRVTAIYGGRAYEPQLAALRRGRRHRRRHARTPARPRRAAPPRARPGRAPSCSTRPTRCSTWASCPTSSASCGCSPSSATPCCSRPRCPARSSPCRGRS